MNQFIPDPTPEQLGKLQGVKYETDSDIQRLRFRLNETVVEISGPYDQFEDVHTLIAGLPILLENVVEMGDGIQGETWDAVVPAVQDAKLPFDEDPEGEVPIA